MTRFPFVPRHEVSGKISEIGDHVSHFSVGGKVGLDWHAGYCMTYDQCLGGHHNLCLSAESTIIGRHGRFADTIRAHSVSVTKLPNDLNVRISDPLLCGGMAVFNPLVQFGISPTDHAGMMA